MENKLAIQSVSEKMLFIRELISTYGENISIGELETEFLIKQASLPVEECRFTGISGLSEKDEFTGTIKEIVESYGMSKKELSNPKIVEWLVTIFTEGYNWIADINGEESVAIKCVPIDRFVNKEEANEYLKKLAEEL